MKVSIVTVVRNGSETIESAINSVISQSYTDIEYLVIDGDSSDETMQIVNRYKDKIDAIVSEEDDGIYDAMNKGIERSTGEVVGMLNADDVFSSDNVIEDIVKAFAQDKKIDACYGDLVYVCDTDVSKVTRYWKSEQIGSADSVYKVPPHPTFYCKRALYKKYGLYDTTYSLAADYELMLRFIYDHGIPVTYIPEVLVRMREGGATNKGIKNIVK